MDGQAHILAVAHTKDLLVINPGPLGYASICPTLIKLTITERPPNIRRVMFDLSKTERVDSTFVGFLVGLKRKAVDGVNVEVLLHQPSQVVLQPLETMGVLHFFDVFNEFPTQQLEWRTLSAQVEDLDNFTDLIIDAHENLIDADPRNAPTFDSLVKGLRIRRKDKPSADD